MSMFAKAKPLNGKAKTSTKTVDTTVKVTGLEEYALVDSALKNLTTIKRTLEVQVKTTIRALFLENCHGKRPENFRGSEGRASASCELRKRSSASPLTDEEAALLDAHKIPYDVVSDTVETFVINPEHLEWLSKNSAKVEKALAGIKDLPVDLFMKQEAHPKRVVTDETVMAAFKCKDVDAVLDTVTTLAIKPRLEAEFDAKQFINILGGK